MHKLRKTALHRMRPVKLI